MTGKRRQFWLSTMIADVRDLTVRALEALNYQVLEADNGRVALDLLRGKVSWISPSSTSSCLA